MSDKVQAIPTGFHTLTPHLVVRNAAEALEFYKKALGAEVLHIAKMPDGRIMHAALRIGDSMLILNDEMPEHGALSPLANNGSGVTIHIYTEDADGAFNRAVSAGAQVRMPLMDQFWGDRYGIVADPYGHQWSIATHVKDISPEEMQKIQDAMAAQTREQLGKTA
jgi:PhnB protein